MTARQTIWMAVDFPIRAATGSEYLVMRAYGGAR